MRRRTGLVFVLSRSDNRTVTSSTTPDLDRVVTGPGPTKRGPVEEGWSVTSSAST